MRSSFRSVVASCDANFKFTVVLKSEFPCKGTYLICCPATLARSVRSTDKQPLDVPRSKRKPCGDSSCFVFASITFVTDAFWF